MLNKEQINQHHEEGFMVYSDFLDHKQVMQMKEENSLGNGPKSDPIESLIYLKL